MLHAKFLPFVSKVWYNYLKENKSDFPKRKESKLFIDYSRWNL